MTQGSRALDDFCKLFFGGENTAPMVKPYQFSDIVEALNSIAPYDWKSYFTRRLTLTTEDAPIEGITATGWQLKYDEKPTTLYEQTHSADKSINHTASIGMVLSQEGAITDVIRTKAADQAGLAVGMKIVAVNSRRFSAEVLSNAITAAKDQSVRLELLAENGDFFRTYSLDYHDGLRYPQLTRDESRPDLLSRILTPLTPEPNRRVDRQRVQTHANRPG
jgi:predicted metalloprotease with PDZ domain